MATRRDFLRAVLLGSGALALSRCGRGSRRPAPAPPGSAGRKVVVIGAGMAGISCGRALHERGFEVVILEARDRIGGRIYTDRSLGFAVERGANWIEGEDKNPVAAETRRAGIRTVVDSSQGAFFDHDGRRLGAREVQRLQEVTKQLGELGEELAEGLERDTALEPALRRGLEGEKLSAFERRVVDFGMASIELDLAGGLEHASLFEFGEGEAFSGDSLFLPDGYDRIVEAVGKGLEVRLSEVVKEVGASERGVVVTTTRGEHAADAVVVSVPLGVLKQGSIRFTPALGGPKSDAIRRLEMGTLNKVILRFPRAFWPADGGTFFHLSATRGEFPEIVDWNAFAGKPALILFQPATFAKEAERWSDAESVDRAMKVVKRCFGGGAPEPDAFLVQRWNADPWTRGSYSFLPVGATPADRDALAAPHGRVFFCGEATSRDYPATVHGAYLSGEREADRIAKSLATAKPG